MASSVKGDLVGRVLSGRYRLLALIGVGASARVYLADDVRLRRRVAVKVLHASLADDDAFLRRFQREAEALAPLTHPNIVIIHDVNDGDNALGEPPYLVTEYLAGGSLRNLLDLGYRLSPSQAARIGLDAAHGLQFAHARELVHRDIKPANLLFGDDQRTRIADFGLARALADFGRTEPSGSPEGTARYLSPEQARGRMLDGRSDVYSLALVLIEAVTGSVPFTADTWQGTAMARLDRALDAPDDLGPLGAVIEAAGTLDPAERIDASELVTMLESAARRLPKADRLPVDGSMLLEHASLLDDHDPTLHVTRMAGSRAVSSDAPRRPTKPFDLAELGDDVPQSHGSQSHGSQSHGSHQPVALPASDAGSAAPTSSTASAAHSTASAAGPSTASASVSSTAASPHGPGTSAAAPAPEAAPSEEASASRRRSVIAAVVVLVAALLAAGLIAVLRRPPIRTVPSVGGRTVAEARAALDALGLRLSAEKRAYDPKVGAGRVLTQVPIAGARLRKGRTVVVTVSKGEQPVRVPTLTGLSFDAAVVVLRNAGLRTISPPRSSDSETVAEGLVLDWSPRGEVAPRSVVNVIVSSGPPVVDVPRVSGLAPDAAVAALAAAGLASEQQKVFSDQTARGLVAYSSPKAAVKARKGSTVKLFVSLGPDLVAVPNVIGLSPADATTKMREAGLKVAATEGPADLPVLYTRPRRTTKVKRGTSITLYTTDQVPDLIAASTTTVPAVEAAAPVSTSVSRPTTTR